MSTTSNIHVLAECGDRNRENDVLVRTLSLERCRQYIAHLWAITHLGAAENQHADEFLAYSTRNLFAALECEIELLEAALNK